MKTERQPTAPPYIRLATIEKSFGITKALSGMDLDVRLGEVLGLVGPNGAGKSTLMKVITGAQPATKGKIAFSGVEIPTDRHNVHSAIARGISCAYQELSLCANLKVYENFLVNQMSHTPFERPGWRRRAIDAASIRLARIFPGHGIEVDTVVEGLSLAQRQMVEIAKAMSMPRLKVLVLDEPTSSLSLDRISQLHQAVRTLAAAGVAIIYISHKLDEIMRVCDQVVVMKGGRAAWEGPIAETDIGNLIAILGGKVSVASGKKAPVAEAHALLRIERLNTRALHGIDLVARKGEVIGIAGLDGSGQKELIQEIWKASRRRSGSHGGIKIATGVAYVSGDRQQEGLFPQWDIARNIVIASLPAVSTLGALRMGRLRAFAQGWYDKLKFKAQGIDDPITRLSGGNQQKALLARGLAADAGLILLNDPTCGVDIETKQEIYALLGEAKAQGKCVILHSTEDLEMEQCDRVYVMHEGRIASELAGERVTVKNIIDTSFQEKAKSSAAGGEAEADGSRMSAQKRSRGFARRLGSNRALLAFVSLIAILAVNSFLNHRVMSYLGLRIMYSSAVPLVFMALGQMFIVVTGGIDLGNGLSLGLMNVIVAFIVVTNPAIGLALAILFVLGYVLLALIIQWTRIPAIVITLGASFIWLGIALLVSPVPGGKAPDWLAAFYNFDFPLVPMPLVISAAAAAASYWILRRSKYGIIINGIGGNPAAIHRAGWSQTFAMMATYALSGIMVVVGSLMLTAIANSGDCNSTRSYNMLSIAAIILGGCEFAGGIGAPVGVVAAALAISSISFLLSFIGIDSNLQSAVTGLILIVALAWKLVSGKLEASR